MSPLYRSCFLRCLALCGLGAAMPMLSSEPSRQTWKTACWPSSLGHGTCMPLYWTLGFWPAGSVAFGQPLIARSDTAWLMLVTSFVSSRICSPMSSKNCKVICWNVRGLNDGAKRASVRIQIISSDATIACLQETKIKVWTRTLLLETLRTDMVDNVVFLPSVGMSGGVLIAVSDRYFKLNQAVLTKNTRSLRRSQCWLKI